MACSSCSSGAPSSTLVPHNACGCSSTPAPPRVANPPTVPVKFEWVSRVRNFLCGRLAIFQKDGEIGALQSAFSRQLIFDAADQTVRVASLATDAVNDNYGCQDQPMFGFPLQGLAPGCRDIGEHPPRNVAVVRPYRSSRGEIMATLVACPAAPGLVPETAPVLLVPEALPETIPANITILGYVDVPAEGCSPSTKRWYVIPESARFTVDDANLETYEFPNKYLEVADDANFGVATWEKVGGKWVLRRGLNVSLGDMIRANVGSPFAYLAPPITMRNEFNPNGVPWTTVNFNYDLTTVPGYKAEYTGVIVFVEMFQYTFTRQNDIILDVNGVEYGRVKAGQPNASDAVSCHLIIPIPPGKTLNFNVYEYINIFGTVGSSGVWLRLDGFIR